MLVAFLYFLLFYNDFLLLGKMYIFIRLFWINKGLMVFENLIKQFRLHKFLTTQLLEVSNNLSRINK